MVAGRNRSRPPLISATAIVCPLVTATPLSVRLPAPGSELIFTARSVFAGESFGSPNPKSAAPNRYGVSSGVVTDFEVPEGASLTEVTLIVIVFGAGSRLRPPLAVPPLSCTWKVKLA